jgi:N-acetylglutamate synthase-like GNAT family acetyltransferase
MIRTASTRDLHPIRDLLSRSNDMPYDIAAVAEEKCFGAGLSGPPRVRVVDEDGALRGVAVTCGTYLRLLAVDRAHRRRGIGSRLLDDSGAAVIAAEPGNYFAPGVMEPEFFVKRGFREIGTTWNLHVDLRRSDPSPGLRPPSPRRAGRGQGEGMLGFVRGHFGAAWALEAERAAIAHFIDGVGFAVAEGNNRGLGTFGPMGVAASHRGRGHGRTLLLACLADLRNLGYERAIIPWADGIEFYRKSCGAEPAHRFVRLAKSL